MVAVLYAIRLKKPSLNIFGSMLLSSLTAQLFKWRMLPAFDVVTIVAIIKVGELA